MRCKYIKMQYTNVVILSAIKENLHLALDFIKFICNNMYRRYIVAAFDFEIIFYEKQTIPICT